MDAITTNYLGATNTKGSRIVASCPQKRTVVAYDHALSMVDNHERAADRMAVELGWLGGLWMDMASATVEDGRMVHIVLRPISVRTVRKAVEVQS